MSALRDLGTIAADLERQAHQARRQDLRDNGATVRYFEGLALRIRQAILSLEGKGRPFEFKGKIYMRVAGGQIVRLHAMPYMPYVDGKFVP